MPIVDVAAAFGSPKPKPPAVLDMAKMEAQKAAPQPEAVAEEDVQEQRPGIELPAPRRFGTADLNRYGGWILRRLLKAMPGLTEQGIAGWLTSAIYSGDYLFLCQEHSVAMAQVLRVAGLEGKPIVREKFVFAMEGYTREAAYFYDSFRAWAKALGADVMVVEELTDVPHEDIKAILDGARLFTRQEVFVKV